MTRSTVSICMATYNGLSYVEKQIESIVAQMQDEDELVIVDDCSLDGTPALLIDFAARDPRIKVLLNEKNMGVAHSFEKAITGSKNEILFLSDQDDIWLPDRVELTLKYFENDSGVSAVLVNARILAFEELTDKTFYPEKYNPEFSILSQALKNKFIGCCMCFKRDLLLTALPFPRGISMHDWWLGCNAILHGKVVYIDKCKILYRRHSTNASPSSRRPFMQMSISKAKDIYCLFMLLLRKKLKVNDE